jgi:UDP-glucose 4-epimerase
MRTEVVDRYYNVGTGKRTSLKELAGMLVELTGCEKEINYAPRSQATLVRNRIGSPKRAREEIGFEAKLDLMEGLKRVIDWRRTHKTEVAARRRAAGLPSD